MAHLPIALAGLLRDGDLAKWIQRTDGLPDITVALPMLRGSGFDGVSAPLLKEIDSDYSVRAFGRALGDPLLSPVFFAAGYLITLYPEFNENLRKKAPPAEFVADAIIDSVGFGVGDIAGDYAGALTIESGPAAIPVKLGFDIGAGLVYDTAVDAYGVRDWLTDELSALGHHPTSDDEARKDAPQPIPTPPQPAPTGTPTPP